MVEPLASSPSLIDESDALSKGDAKGAAEQSREVQPETPVEGREGSKQDEAASAEHGELPGKRTPQ